MDSDPSHLNPTSVAAFLAVLLVALKVSFPHAADRIEQFNGAIPSLTIVSLAGIAWVHNFVATHQAKRQKRHRSEETARR